MPETITVKEAKSALKNMKKLVPANPKFVDDLELSVKDAILFMASDLIRMSKRGFTIKELSAGLAN